MQKRQPGRPVPGPGQEPAYPIASVNNALRLLLLFRSQSRVRLSEASEHLGVAHSTAHRLMAMLAYHGFVRREPEETAEKFKHELREQAAWLEDQLPGAT